MDLDYEGACNQLIPIDDFAAPKLAACSCINEYAPVCGFNNETYNNSCLAGCENIQIAY